jgi:hypothetical protein
LRVLGFQRADWTARRGRDAQTTSDCSQPKEIAFDQVQLGDHVEIEFSNSEESGSTQNVHQSQRMRQTHGRDRTFVGYATSIVVVPGKDHEKARSTTDSTSNERAR